MTADLKDQTIAEVLALAVQQYGNKTAVVDKDQTLTFNDLDRLSKRLAAHLYHLGIRKGDVVAVQLPNSWPYIISHLAVARLGAVFLPLNLTYRQKELTFMFKHSETKAVIVVDEWKGFHHAGLMEALKAQTPSLEHVITWGEKRAGSDLLFSDFMAQDPPDVNETDLYQQAPSFDDFVTVMFTSGTESDPKAVLHTYRTFVPIHLLSAKEYGFSDREVVLSLTPLCHMFAFPIITSSLYYGAKQVLLDDYAPELVLQLLEEHGVSFLIAAPAQMLDILTLVRNKEKIETQLRMVLTGGSKIPAKMVQEFREQFNCVIGAQWGMTEVGAGTFTRPDDPPHLAVETVGRANPTGEVEIIAEDGKKLPYGEVGEIAYRGDSLFIEYYKNPQATQESFTEDRYFLTGDLGWKDEQGYVHFVGRKKDIINRGGLKVHTSEVEEALMMHPNIRQVAVVSVPDERLGEKGMAIVSLRGSEPFTLEDMVKFLLEMGMAKYKIPEYLEIRDELPTTPSGKIRKGHLRQEISKRTEHTN